MKTAPRVLFLFCVAADAQSSSRFFEQAGKSAWRGGADMVVLADGFLLRHGGDARRFRWDASMHLEKLVPEEPLVSHAYRLKAAGSIEIPHAARLRAASSDGAISVVYYFGSRGLEFDIEAAAGVRFPSLSLESMDAGFSLDNDGRVTMDGDPFLLRPVVSSGPRTVPAQYRLEGSRRLTFDVDAADPRAPLKIDPVMTYASYFAGTGAESPVAVREMADGTILIAGNTSSVDLPDAVSVNALVTQPTYFLSQCFVARFAPGSKQLLFTSYLSGSTGCSSMDVDGSGRILVAGDTEGAGFPTTPGAQHPTIKYTVDSWLARVSADGRTLDYATYLNLNFSANIDVAGGRFFMRAGPGDTVYLVGGPADGVPVISGGYQTTPGSILLLRYNIATKSFDQETYFGDSQGSLSGIQVSPSGALFFFGSTYSTSLPLQNPIQNTPQSGGSGFVAALSPDFRSLLFSGYLGSIVSSITFNSDGSLWAVGATTGPLPGLPTIRPGSTGPSSLFVAQFTPGSPVIRNGFIGEYNFPLGIEPEGFLAGGLFCLTESGFQTNAFAGGAALGGGSEVPMVACVNDAGNDFQMITPVGGYDGHTGDPTFVAAPSQAGGVWSLQMLNGLGAAYVDALPAYLKPGAIQPQRPGWPVTWSADLVLRHIDLTTPAPVLSLPEPLALYDLQGNFSDTVELSGKNFALGMQLSVQGQQSAVVSNNPISATLNYQSPSLPGPTSNSLNLRAGNYTGQLVIPTQPQPVMSDPFPVIIRNLPPAGKPFAQSPTNSGLFVIAPPIYGTSTVMWNGMPLPIAHTSNGQFQVQIPPQLSGPGTSTLTLSNPGPGGGVQQQTISIGALTPVTQPPAVNPTPISLSAPQFQVDVSRQLLYAIATTGAAQWSLSSYALPSGNLVQSATFPKNGATLAVDLKLSTDGSYLYFTDDSLRITRFRTDALQQDLQFQIAADAPPVSSDPTMRQSILVLDGAPESILVTTPAGRMMIYDRDQPRTYNTDDFPSLVVTAFDPVLATNTYIYALPRADVSNSGQSTQSACVVRYPVDGLGLGPAEDICSLAETWGKYPEMQIIAGNLVIENDQGAYGILPQLNILGSMRTSSSYQIPEGVVISPAANTLGTSATSYRISISDLNTGEPIGHYPAEGALAGYPGTVTFAGDTMVIQIINAAGNSVMLVPQWQSAIQQYSN